METQERLATLPPEPATAACARARVLIVEDERLIALDIQKTLERQGYQVVAIVSRGDHAVHVAGETHPDVVLMDIRLKGDMDGIQAAREIRQRFDTPVVYLTAHTDENTLQRAVETGAFGYLLKPFEERELYSTIEVVCFKHRLERQLRENQQWLATTLESIGDAIIATDEHGRVRLTNPAADRLTGRPFATVAGSPLGAVFQVVDAATRQPAGDPFAIARDAGSPLTLGDNLILVTHAGSEVPVDVSVAPLRDRDGRLMGVVTTVHDLTERRQWEQRLHDEVEQRIDRLQASERRRMVRQIDAEAGQALTSLLVGLRLLEERAARHEPLGEHIADLKRVVDNIRERLHRLATNLL